MACLLQEISRAIWGTANLKQSSRAWYLCFLSGCRGLISSWCRNIYKGSLSGCGGRAQGCRVLGIVVASEDLLIEISKCPQLLTISLQVFN